MTRTTSHLGTLATTLALLGAALVWSGPASARGSSASATFHAVVGARTDAAAPIEATRATALRQLQMMRAERMRMRIARIRTR